MTLKLELSGDTEIVGTRRFAASPARVFTAHTDPDLLSKWMTGPEGWVMTVCESVAKPGGDLVCTWRDEEGNEFSLRGHYLEVETPHRLVHVERWDGSEDMVDTEVETLFEPDGNGTLLTIRMRYPNKDARDAALASGMAEGMEVSYARVDAL